ncbi:RlpA-like double-psi beta-barrel-protein domain-containing protein-containing protein [Trichophaea hybrida]|nr:RlpA-like double-psi beta-barrel-protein domain-containing protein-containing protein [Trichophaea hybrida]
MSIVIDAHTSYSYAPVSLSSGQESGWCCACYELTFTSDTVVRKKMVVQNTNIGDALGGNRFNAAIPGGEAGEFNACFKQYGALTDGWGARYGGCEKGECNALPAALREGRFDWFQGADNPTVTWREVWSYEENWVSQVLAVVGRKYFEKM